MIPFLGDIEHLIEEVVRTEGESLTVVGRNPRDRTFTRL